MSTTLNVPEIFGSDVFNESVMKARLRPEIFNSWKQCIENGGFFGIGLMGKGDYEVLPASHTDFIFATVCEKFGIIGGVVVVILLMVMVIRVFMIARSCGRDYGCLICVGVGAILVVQTLENVGMCLAMLPVVGITLPFLSYGGSSIVTLYMAMGVVSGIKMRSPAMRRLGRPIKN